MVIPDTICNDRFKRSNVTTPRRVFTILFRLGAANRIRTYDPIITNDVLYQLSYCGSDLPLSDDSGVVQLSFSTKLADDRPHTVGRDQDSTSKSQYPGPLQ
jgi:hypothetical protein